MGLVPLWIRIERLSVVIHTCNLSTQETKAEGQQAWDQPGLLHKALSQKEEEA
jgi:hypothetical protein